MKRMLPFGETIKLEGFNNLTKSLSFNLYDFCVARNDAERRAYMEYIDRRFSAAKMTEILQGICNIIEAKVLAVSDQNYEPWGASSMILMSDSFHENSESNFLPSSPGGVSFHLDKSHVTAHTYPDFRADGTICSFRSDIDISTCGSISPLRALNYMFKKFDSDVVVIDYKVRGYTRDSEGRRVYMDHDLKSIQNFIDPEVLADYHAVDLTLQSDNIWQTKMLRTNLDVESYFLDPVDLGQEETDKYMEAVRREMRGILYMWPE